MPDYKIRPSLNEKERKELSAFDPLISHLLFYRGIKDNENAYKFVNPDYEKHIHDPFLLKDARKASEKIIEYIKNNKKIAIYSDYDADGIPGASALSHFFNEIGYKNYVVYIPHRHDEGFGLNEDAIIQLKSENVDLIITIDCGITDYTAVEKANSLGLMVVITDHHEPPEVIPNAFAIINHKQKDCIYPDKNLCGSGVIFKLISSIIKIERFGLVNGWEKWLLDLVGIATLSDMVSLQGENRVFAYYGLMVLRKTRRLGLLELFRKLKIDLKYISEDDIGFMLTPRINAASRMGVPKDAFNLLVANNENDAKCYAEHLDKINNERKGQVASIVKDVKKHMKERYENIPNVIVIGNPEWRPSLLGLVANTLVEEYKRPVFLWGRDGGNVIKGSCRGPIGTSLVSIMRNSVPETFLQFGGHHQSGGFSVSNEEIHYLEKRLNDSNQKNSDDKKSEFIADENDLIDLEIDLKEIDNNFVDNLNKLSPFGMGNPKPVFLVRHVIVKKKKIFGKSNEHVELVLDRGGKKEISAIAFFGAKNDWYEIVREGDKINLVFYVEKSYFRGRAEIRLRIKDLHTEVHTEITPL